MILRLDSMITLDHIANEKINVWSTSRWLVQYWNMPTPTVESMNVSSAAVVGAFNVRWVRLSVFLVRVLVVAVVVRMIAV